MKLYICPKCEHVLRKEKDRDLRKVYKFFCEYCDENFFKFEALKIKLK